MHKVFRDSKRQVWFLAICGFSFQVFLGGEHLVYIFCNHFGKQPLGRWIFAPQRSPDFFNAVVRDAAGGQEIPLEQVVMVGLEQGGVRC